jgi:transposase
MESHTAADESKKAKRLTRKQRKDLGRRIWSDRPGLDVVHRDAAGIDIGSREHYVAVGPGRCSEPVRVFGCFTTDLRQLAEWLKECGIQTVVMQSTGVYWIPVYDVLEQHGFDVWLVNARDTRNLPGRKSDVQESQWLLKLHTYGMLRKSFRPTPEIRALRTCWRERGEYVQQAGACIQRMQKALTEMNVQLATALSDLSGVTGMSILRSIVAGERDGMRLAEFRDPHIKASKETIAKSLEGTWLPEQLAVLKRQLGDWDHIQRQIAACDVDLQVMMKQMPSAKVKPTPSAPPAEGTTAKRKRRKNGKSSKNEPTFNLEEELKRVSGVDLSRIDGIKVNTIQTVITEAGLDMSKWPTEDYFVSWIGLSPRNDITGGKVVKKKTRKVVSRLAGALRMAATTLRESDSYLGAQFRRLRTTLSPPKAITAMAAKLGRLVYRMLRYGQEYVDRGTTLYEQKYRQQQIHHLGKKAAQHGFALVPVLKPA